jgi:hypothetical protein
MAITDISISEELMTNAPSIKYRGNEGPKSPQEIEMMMMSGGQPLPEDPTKPVNPFAPKPTGPVLPDKMMAGTDTPEIEIEMLQELLKLFREKFNRDPVSIDELKRAIGQMREKAAYGGIMGLDGRKQYGIGSWFQEKIMDPIKENPLVAAAAAAAGVDYFGIPDYDILGDLGGLGGNKVLTGGNTIGELLAKKPGGDDADEDDKSYGEMITSAIGKNIIPIAGGLGAGLFTKNTESDTPGLPSDTTGIQLADLKKTANLLDQKQGMAANLNFLPTVASRKYSPAEMAITYQNAANGGRIGYNQGNAVVDYESDPNYQGWKQIYEVNPDAASMNEKHKIYENYYMSKQNMKAEGGIMDLGGMEKDYRAEGGFVPIGKQEKADDVPARLSVNEFVFTADAVRNAGGGDIDQGAQVMENMMKHLEAGGQVSEESQGMAGARDMFATSQRLGDVV